MDPIFTYVLLLFLTVLGSVIVADVVFLFMVSPLEYARVRLEFEALNRLVADLRRAAAVDGRAERRLRKLAPRYEEVRRRAARLSLYRLLVILPFYVASAWASLSAEVGVPDPCCTPILSVVVGEACIVHPSILVALSYIAAIPLIQESPFTMLMLKRLGVQGVFVQRRR